MSLINKLKSYYNRLDEAIQDSIQLYRLDIRDFLRYMHISKRGGRNE